MFFSSTLSRERTVNNFYRKDGIINNMLSGVGRWERTASTKRNPVLSSKQIESQTHFISNMFLLYSIVQRIQRTKDLLKISFVLPAILYLKNLFRNEPKMSSHFRVEFQVIYGSVFYISISYFLKNAMKFFVNLKFQ